MIAQLVRPDRRRVTIHAKFLVACDGANSTVRQFLGIPLEEAGPRVRHCSVFFSSRDPRLRTYGRAFVTVAPRGLTLVSRDEEDSWTGSIPVLDDAPFTQDPITLLRECLGTDFTVDEVRSVADWTGSLSVATSYRLGSIFLAGDSAHQFFPAGGHGANTGIADAVNLGWKLAAVVQGWGGEGLLDSYDAERRPVALFNREMCTNLLEVWRRFRRLVDLGVSREQIAGFLAEETHQIDNLGVHFDYRYTDSPTIYREDSPAPSWRWRRIEPTTWPGCRAPAIRLADGSRSSTVWAPASPWWTSQSRGPASGWWRQRASAASRYVTCRSRTPRHERRGSGNWCWCALTSTSPGAATSRRRTGMPYSTE